MKAVTIRFYTCSMVPDDGPSVADLLFQLDATPIEERVAEYKGETVWLPELVQTNSNQFEGDVVLMRSFNQPASVVIQKHLRQDLRLADDEELGEEAAFLFDISTGVLVLQHHNAGPRVTSLAALLEKFAGKGYLFSRSLVPSDDALRRLSQAKEFLSLEFKLVTPKHEAVPGFSRSEGSCVSEALAIQEHFNSPTIDVALSMGRRNGKLKNVQEAIREILHRGDVKKLKVKTVNTSGEPDMIDLLEETISYRTEIDSTVRRFPYRSRAGWLRNAWNEHRELLRNRYA